MECERLAAAFENGDSHVATPPAKSPPPQKKIVPGQIFHRNLAFPSPPLNHSSTRPMPENPIPSVRLDKWLWAVRVFKTRTLAAAACRLGRVTIDGQQVKPSREVRINDIVVILKDEISRHYKVLQTLRVRVAASKVPEFAENQTPPAPPQPSRHFDAGPYGIRPKGAGRPTKKDRRQIQRFNQ
jgi:ribosome-associated heat shock protein Hsp15